MNGITELRLGDQLGMVAEYRQGATMKTKAVGSLLLTRDTNPTAVDIPILLNAEQLVGILGVPTKRVYELDIPSIRVSPRCIRWRRDTVLEWMKEREGKS